MVRGRQVVKISYSMYPRRCFKLGGHLSVKKRGKLQTAAQRPTASHCTKIGHIHPPVAEILAIALILHHLVEALLEQTLHLPVHSRYSRTVLPQRHITLIGFNQVLHQVNRLLVKLQTILVLDITFVNVMQISVNIAVT